MDRKGSINFGNVILSLSDALDLASPKLVQHQQRTTYIAYEMGKAANIPQDRLEGIFTASLLHDIGALSLEEKIRLHEFESIDMSLHCVRGEVLFKTISWLEPYAKIVRFHHKPWQDWEEDISGSLVLDTQIVSLADYIERLIKRDKYILHQNEDIISQVSSRANTLFHPQIVNLFKEISSREEFWLDISSARLYSILMNNGPYKKFKADINNIFTISELFRNIIDFRSHFTATHSSGVAAAAVMLSKKFGFSDYDVKMMEIAGNVHDLGKLSIPNTILDKPDKLSKEEFAVIKSHTYYTYFILNTIEGFNQISEWAAYHHEKLDGSGYPFHCKDDILNTGARIMAVADIFTAIAEDRPYRKGMSKNGIINILKQFANRNLLEDKIIEIVLNNFDEIFSFVKEKQLITKEFYEKQIEL
ncbi:HD domain-containing protein [Candidatus Poribacteria bacterium]|nr:HD domain-containing protein [Candidatus Poribacteria bacterium]